MGCEPGSNKSNKKGSGSSNSSASNLDRNNNGQLRFPYGVDYDDDSDGAKQKYIGGTDVNDNNGRAKASLGNGAFRRFQILKNTGIELRHSFAIDLNKDGYVDIILHDRANDDAIYIYFGGARGFSSAVQYSGGEDPTDIFVADFNKDQILDILVSNGHSQGAGYGAAHILLGNGDGTFGVATPIVTGGIDCQAIYVADFNNDGNFDFATPNWTSFDLSIVLGNGDGTFGAPNIIPLGVDSYPQWIFGGDFDNNGTIDLAISKVGLNAIGILLGDGTGNFTAKRDVKVGKNPERKSGKPTQNGISGKADVSVGTWPRGLDGGDFNRDGVLDLAVAIGFDDIIQILVGNGDGSFTIFSQYATGDRPFGLKVGDVNGDSFPDIVTANRNAQTFSIFFGNGDATFQNPPNYITLPLGPYGVNIEDVNGDNKLDIILPSGEGSSAAVYLGK